MRTTILLTVGNVTYDIFHSGRIFIFYTCRGREKQDSYQQVPAVQAIRKTTKLFEVTPNGKRSIAYRVGRCVAWRYESWVCDQYHHSEE